MAITTYPSDLQERLSDLAEFGIRLSNTEGMCSVCGQAIDPKWSDGISIDSRCRSCSEGSTYHPAYSPETVWPKQVLNAQFASTQYDAIVKIEGELYYARYSHGSSFDIVNLETGELVKRLALDMSTHLLKAWHEEQRDATIRAYVVQLYWPAIKEDVGQEVFHHANWMSQLPLYDIGHSGRGWEKYGRVYVRLYLRLIDNFQRNDFDLLALQLVKNPHDGYLSSYEVVALPNIGIVNLKWSQAGTALCEALYQVKPDRVLVGFTADDYMEGRVRATHERYLEMATRRPMPCDAWITLIVKMDPYGGEGVIAHELDHILIHPF